MGASKVLMGAHVYVRLLAGRIHHLSTELVQWNIVPCIFSSPPRDCARGSLDVIKTEGYFEELKAMNVRVVEAEPLPYFLFESCPCVPSSAGA